MGLSYGWFLCPESLLPFGTFIARVSGRKRNKAEVLASACWDSNPCPSAGCVILEKLVTQLFWASVSSSGKDADSYSLGLWGGFCELKYTACLEDHPASSGYSLTLVSCYKSHISLSLPLAFNKLNWKEPNNARLSFSSLEENVISPYSFTALCTLCKNPGKWISLQPFALILWLLHDCSIHSVRGSKSKENKNSWVISRYWIWHHYSSLSFGKTYKMSDQEG